MGISTKVETPPNILHDGHRNPYQSEKAIKSGETVFFAYIPTREMCPVKSLTKKYLLISGVYLAIVLKAFYMSVPFNLLILDRED